MYLFSLHKRCKEAEEFTCLFSKVHTLAVKSLRAQVGEPCVTFYEEPTILVLSIVSVVVAIYNVLIKL